jgi:hypothetical protein
MVETVSEKTPLQCKLDEFGEQLSKVSYSPEKMHCRFTCVCLF